MATAPNRKQFKKVPNQGAWRACGV